jgi:hypothetical protein
MPASSLTLYEIGAEGQFIQDCLIDTEGELTPEIEERLNALMVAGPDKIQAAGHVLANLENAQAACEMEAKRLKDRAAAFDAGISRLKARMATALDLAFNGKLKTDTATFWTQAGPTTYAVDLAEESSLEELQKERPDFVRTKLELDKQAVKDAFNREEPLPDSIFVTKTEGRRYLRVK